jgi:glycosyltransferase involved in cell wall biosynthesis
MTTILINHLMEPPNRITGVTRYLFALLKEMAKDKAFDYVLLTTWDASQIPSEIKTPTVRIVTRPFYKSMPYNLMMQMIAMPRLIREHDVALEFNCSAIGCCWPMWPRVITVHDLVFNILPRMYPFRHVLWWRLFFPLALAGARWAVCVSRQTEADVHHYYARFRNKTAVVYEAGAQLPEAAAADAKDLARPYAVYVGNMAPNKNPPVLAQALKILEERGSPITIYHVGRDELALLSDAVAAVGLMHPIKLVGLASDAVLARMYKNAACLVSTSIHEGFCLPIVEAQCLGTPVVCSDIPILREVAGEGAIYFESDNAAALADRLAAIFRDPQLRDRVALAARRNAARFSWAKAAREIEQVFADALR